MAAGFKVTGAAVVLVTEDLRERYLYRSGAVFPQEGFTEKSIKHALSVGLIKEAELAEGDGSPEEKVELPSKDWNHDRIDTWASEQTPPIELVNPDPEKQFTKELKIEQIAAELAKRSE